MMTARSVDEAHAVRRVMSRRTGAHACLWLLLTGSATAALVFHLIADAGRGPMFGAIVFCASRAGVWLGTYWGWVEGWKAGADWRRRHPHG